MQQDTGKLKRSELNLREHLSALERDWLGGCLVSQVGVKVAIYGNNDPHQLVVEYDSNLMNGTDLLDILYLRGGAGGASNRGLYVCGAVDFGESPRGRVSLSRK